MIYHIIEKSNFLSRVNGDQYLPAGFEETGFVHCALEESVIAVANDYFVNCKDTLLLLRIDPAKLRAQTKYEAAAPLPGAGNSHVQASPEFPHVYGPIELSAIEGVGVMETGIGGYGWPADFHPPEYFFKNIFDT